ncbi:CIS tube protein [Sorangium sp. So ce1151]|uniref:CIS tube protein n=1 Tax=Sorangium sp. So ce1151 TaxID=3133332 RepID=UPI003F5F2D78
MIVGLNLFKLEKLKIKAFKDVARRQPSAAPFEAMFNPASFSDSYAITWGAKQGVGSSGPQLSYSGSKPRALTLTLVVDGTGVESIGILAPMRKSVKDRVKTFLDVTFRYNGVIHEPNYLLVEWGSLIFSCRLSAVDIKYTAFERDGTPLRAELQVTLISDKAAKARAREEGKTSPDLTHSRVVRSGDTLPLLTRDIYGSSARYLDVARWNRLDDFRRLIPGQEIFFPPLANLGAGTSGEG